MTSDEGGDSVDLRGEHRGIVLGGSGIERYPEFVDGGMKVCHGRLEFGDLDFGAQQGRGDDRRDAEQPGKAHDLA